MTLLAPMALLFGLTLPVIVALWLLRRRRQEREVSSNYLWRRVLREVRANVPWQRLRTHLLLILQLAAAALLALALARPNLSGIPGGRAHLIVLLDSSGSMLARSRLPDGPTRFQQAQAEARAHIGSLRAGDRVTLLAVERVPRVLVSQAPREQALAALDAAAPSHAVAEWSQAFSLAASMGRGQPGARALVLSDATVGDAILARLGVPARAIRVGEPVPNLAVQLAVRADAGGGPPSALGRVVNHGREQAGARVELYVDGDRADQRQVDVPPGGAAEIVWRDLPARARFFEARLLATDALAADDRAWAVLPRPEKVRVLLTTRANLFLERALRLRGDVELVRVRPANYAPGDYQLYVFDGWLPDALPRAALLVFAPPADNPLVKAGEAVSVGRLRAGPGAGQLLAHVPLDDVHVARSRILEAPPWAGVVLEAAEGPLLVAGHRDGRPVAVVGFDVHESDFPLRLGFPLMIHNLLDWLVPPDPVPTRAVAGDPVPLALDPVATSAAVLTPDGRRVPVAPPLPAPPWTDTANPGIYTVVQELPHGERRSAFAVEFPAGESEPPGALAPPTATGDAAAPARAPAREVWPWLASLALAAVGLEWWVYIRGS